MMSPKVCYRWLYSQSSSLFGALHIVATLKSVNAYDLQFDVLMDAFVADTYCRDTLMSVGKHYETGEALPEDIYKKLLAARTYRAGSLSLRQLRFATVDLELHTKYVPGGSESIHEVDRRVSQRTQVLPPHPEDRFLCNFGHIFAGGYAAGYYSYKWAEVLSADAFSAFEDAGLNNYEAVKETGHRFRETVLALGGGKPPLEVFVEFRGREPSPEALLRHSGLLQVS